MQPKDVSAERRQVELFRSRLDSILNLRHPLCVLAQRIDWAAFDREFGVLYAQDRGRPGLPTRLMVGLHYLKHAFNESDESVVERFLENGYWQYFCGFEHFLHELPLDPSSLVRWRKRIGVAGIEKLLAQTIETAKRARLISRSDVERVNVDTTSQEKAIAFPTDARLYDAMRARLVKEAKQLNIVLKQSYTRLSKQARWMQSRYAHAKQMKRARREMRRWQRYLGCVLRDIQRKCPAPDPVLAASLQMAERLWRQKRSDSDKRVQPACARGRVPRQRQGAQVLRVWVQGVGGDGVATQLGVGHRSAARQSLRRQDARTRACANAATHGLENRRCVLRSRLSRKSVLARRRARVACGKNATAIASTRYLPVPPST